MLTQTEKFIKPQLKTDIPDVRPGDNVKVYQKIKEKNKERIQIFEGLVIARKHGKGISATITVRKVVSGIGVEKIFPVHSPLIDKIEITKRSKVRRAKLYYLRTAKGEKAKLKRKEFSAAIADEEQSLAKETEKTAPEQTTETEKTENQNMSESALGVPEESR